MRKRSTFLAAAALVAIALALLWWRRCGGVSHREIRTAVVSEAAAVRSLVDARCDAIERNQAMIMLKVDGLDAKLDAIGRKLDALMKMAEPQLPDGMSPAE